MRRMVDQTGLNERLDQHSRRSGMLVGVSMALVVALLIGTFTWLFFRLDPLFTDFAGRTGVERASPVSARGAVSTRTSTARAAATPPAESTFPQLPTPTALAAATPRTAATPSFTPTHAIADFGQQVNLRAGPSAASARVALVAPGTRLQFLNEEERAGETVWMRFQTERGDTGWVRQIDIIAVAAPSTNPSASPSPSPSGRPTTPTPR